MLQTRERPECCRAFSARIRRLEEHKADIRSVAFGHPDPAVRREARIELDRQHDRVNDVVAKLWAHQAEHVRQVA